MILGWEKLQLPPRGDRAGAPQAAALPELLVILAVSSRRPPYARRAQPIDGRCARLGPLSWSLTRIVQTSFGFKGRF
jgi:hypothetical protein